MHDELSRRRDENKAGPSEPNVDGISESEA